MKNLFLANLLIYGFILSPKIFAVDGVLEINHICATQLGCFSGDVAGYPVTINGSSGSSYRLTSDLIIPDDNTTGISISASNKSIDFNGFSIINVACIGATTSCTPASGSGSGISVSPISNYGINVKNGKVIGMGNHGISLLGPESKITNMTAKWNRRTGLGVGINGTIQNSRAVENNAEGIRFSNRAIIKNNIATSNGAQGIKGLSYAIIENNVTNNNTLEGIFAQGVSSIVIGNTADNNGTDGIEVSGNGLVKNNIVTSNGTFGLNIFSNVTYKDNIIVDNVNDINGGVNIGGNLCGASLCP